MNMVTPQYLQRIAHFSFTGKDPWRRSAQAKGSCYYSYGSYRDCGEPLCAQESHEGPLARGLPDHHLRKRLLLGQREGRVAPARGPLRWRLDLASA